MQIVIGNWRPVVGFVVLSVLVIAILSFLAVDDFTAEATIAIFDIPSEYSTQGNGFSGRVGALLALANSRSLVVQVQEAVADQVPGSGLKLGRLRKAMQAENTGDLLQLQVTWDEPLTAAIIANAWAEKYIEVANRAYTMQDRNSFEAKVPLTNDASQVRIALAALPPSEPDQRSTFLAYLIAAIIGGLIGMLFVLSRDHWRATSPAEPASVSALSD